MRPFSFLDATMRPIPPSKDELALLEPFVGLTLAQIVVPASEAAFAAAAAEILAAGVVGFDTESKPTFKVGEVSTGPHLVQFALPDKAFLFQVQHAEGLSFLRTLLASEQVVKVGFDLKSDGKHIHAKLGASLGGVLDLMRVFRQRGYAKDMGVRTAVGIVLQQNFTKSKRISTSDWSRQELNSSQLLYAANDAYAALQVWRGLNLPLPDELTAEAQ